MTKICLSRKQVTPLQAHLQLVFELLHVLLRLRGILLLEAGAAERAHHAQVVQPQHRIQQARRLTAGQRQRLPALAAAGHLRGGLAAVGRPLHLAAHPGRSIGAAGGWRLRRVGVAGHRRPVLRAALLQGWPLRERARGRDAIASHRRDGRVRGRCQVGTTLAGCRVAYRLVALPGVHVPA